MDKPLSRRYYSPIMASERVQRQIDRLLDDAEAAFAQRNWETVQQRAQDTLALDPDNQDDRTFLAAAQRALDVSSAPIVELASAYATSKAPTASEPSTKGTDLPSGLITYLFTDVQGSTSLWQQYPQEMKNVMARHDFLLTSAVELNGGTVVRPRGEGDSIFAVFPRAMDAVVAACAAQQLLLREIWPEDIVINVRMAMHTGESELRNHDYYGNTVNRCARLRSIAHGGQIVISEVTAQLVRDDLSGGISLRELGAHRLKDLQRPEEVFQLIHPGLPADFPALNSLSAHVPAIPASTPFVGRQQELGTLKAALDNAHAGHGSVAMLAGEPGIGKTRIAQKLANYATDSGTEILWGRSYEEAGMPPFWPWLEVTRSLVRGRDKAQLQSEMGLGGAVVAETVPEVKAALPDLEPPPILEPEQASFRLFESLTTFFTNASRAKPIMVVLEDLQWADTPSLRMLEFLSGRIGDAAMLVLGAYRDAEVTPEHPLTESLANLSREPGFRLEILHRFSAEETNQLIEATGGHSPTKELAQRIQAHTDGNPLFVNEVVRLLLDEAGGLGSIEGSTANILAVPEGVRAVTRQRLRRLSTLCNQLLTTASVVGREFEYSLLYKLTEETTEDDFSAALEEAVRAHLMEELATQPGRYHFSHSLIQQALAEELSTTRRVRLHARIAEALEELYGPDAAAHAAELAHHFVQAATVTGTAKLVHYSTIAGERDLAAYAYEEALDHFRRALAVKERQPIDDEGAALLFGLGRAQAATLPRHQIEEAVVNLTQAFDYYAAAGEFDLAVAIAEYPFYPLVGQRTGNNRLIARALELVDQRSPRAVPLLSRYGRLMGLEEGDYNAAHDAFHQALAIAHREVDPLLEMRTLADAANVDLIHARFQDCLEKAARANALVSRANDPYCEALILYSAMLAGLYTGDAGGGSSQMPTFLALAERLRDRFWLSMAHRINGDVAQLVGDWAVARDLSDTSLSASPTEPRALCSRAVLEYQVGDFAQGEAFLERLVEAMRRTPPGPAMENGQMSMAATFIASITGLPDRLDVAKYAAQQVLSSSTATPWVTVSARIGLGLLSIQQGDIQAAGEHYTALSPYRGTIWMFVMVAVDRVLGLLAQTLGNLDQAAEHFKEALAFCRKAGYRPELAWTCCDYSDVLIERDAEGDRAEAIELLEEALTISGELGMRPLMERVLSRREILGA